MSDVNSYTGGAAGAAGAVTIQAVLCWSEYYNGAWQDMKTSDVNRPADINVSASAMDRNFELDRNRLRIVVAPYREYVPSDALVLAILPPSDGSTPVIPYGPGFVLHNTHSLPTNSIDIPSDLGGLFGAIAQLPLPLRTLKPSRRYSTDQGSGVFSLRPVQFADEPFRVEPRFDVTHPRLSVLAALHPATNRTRRLDRMAVLLRRQTQPVLCDDPEGLRPLSFLGWICRPHGGFRLSSKAFSYSAARDDQSLSRGSDLIRDRM